MDGVIENQLVFSTQSSGKAVEDINKKDFATDNAEVENKILKADVGVARKRKKDKQDMDVEKIPNKTKKQEKSSNATKQKKKAESTGTDVENESVDAKTKPKSTSQKSKIMKNMQCESEDIDFSDNRDDLESENQTVKKNEMLKVKNEHVPQEITVLQDDKSAGYEPQLLKSKVGIYDNLGEVSKKNTKATKTDKQRKNNPKFDLVVKANNIKDKSDKNPKRKMKQQDQLTEMKVSKVAKIVKQEKQNDAVQLKTKKNISDKVPKPTKVLKRSTPAKPKVVPNFAKMVNKITSSKLKPKPTAKKVEKGKVTAKGKQTPTKAKVLPAKAKLSLKKAAETKSKTKAGAKKPKTKAKSKTMKPKTAVKTRAKISKRK